MRILIVEDERRLAEALGQIMRRSAIRPTGDSTGRTGRTSAGRASTT